MLLDEIKELLKTKEKYFSDDEELLKNIVLEDTIKMDKDLIRLLMSNEKAKNHFFVNIDEILIFDKDKFIKFIENKEFLPNSYTSYKNKIGLTDSKGEFIKEKNDVVLSWAYKDCYLEGGQDKEDMKKDEIFYNEILAPDEIDRLLEPKVLTNFKKYDVNGEHKVEDITMEDNLIIKGNNLLALHSLKEKYAGQIKLIYIDPPYNTGNDSFKYNDRFNHSTWLTFMKNRLVVAKELLKDEGIICIEIDNNEFAYLKILLDEIFGNENFINDIVWKRRGGSANPQNRLNNVTEYIMCYAKSQNYKINHIFSLDDENTKKYIKERFTNIDENGRKYMKSPLQSPNLRPNLIYEYKGYSSPKKGWSISKDVMEKWDKEGKLCFPEDKNQNINRKIYLDEYKGQPISNLWTDINVINPMSKERLDFLSGQKPEALIKRLLDLFTEKNDIVLDFHLGSGTTATTAHKIERRYIGIEQMDYIEDISIERLKKVIGNGEQKTDTLFDSEIVTNFDDAGISKETNWQGGGSFVYCELMKWNEIFIEKINNAKNIDNLIKIYSQIKEKAFLNYKFDIEKFEEENMNDFKELKFEEQKEIIKKSLDLNSLYVNLSEIEDETYSIPDGDKNLNKIFYKK